MDRPRDHQNRERQQPDSMGMVHFRAHYLTPQGPGVQEERSRFIRTEDGSPWVYVD
ncbi:YchJ family metal-binding protein [Gleimia europaea]|uniref:YchJ family metal-binding protein n=1 Tax=Gleimia europaea TaxID=66228 RepID=UPI002787948F|nr:YchJ family metal-binding protein [Gleimia europaea]MDP9834135.1 uncharacterized protein YchJ [Gleimia europaea]